MAYTKLVKQIQNPPVTEKVGENQVKNYSGGYVFNVTPLDMLRRFLILGSEKNTYHVGARELTKSNIGNLQKIIDTTDGIKVISMIVDVSVSGAAPTNDHALFALAYVAAKGNLQARTHAYEVLPSVARTGSDLFGFIEYSRLFRGWGMGLRKAVRNWYLTKNVDDMAYQMVKYQSRTKTEGQPGYSQADLLRLSHPKPDSELRSGAFRWSLGKWSKEEVDLFPLPTIMGVYEEVKAAKSEKEVIGLIQRHKLTHEFVPSEWHGSSKVWEALLPNLPPMAMLRNLGRLTSLGLLNDFANIDTVRAVLNDQNRVTRSRLHPIDCLNALVVYREGHGIKGSTTWSPVGRISDVINDAFYMSFGAIKPSGKNVMVAVDVSASMTWHKISNSFLTPRQVSAVMSMVYVRTEPNTIVTAFSAGNLVNVQVGRSGTVKSDGITVMDFSKNDSLDAVIAKIDNQYASATDCSLPMQFATKGKMDIDAFIVFTDNETNSGKHPMKELRNYRASMSKPRSALIVNATLASPFTIADPNDPYSLDVVGFDSTVPSVISEVLNG